MVLLVEVEQPDFSCTSWVPGLSSAANMGSLGGSGTELHLCGFQDQLASGIIFGPVTGRTLKTGLSLQGPQGRAHPKCQTSSC